MANIDCWGIWPSSKRKFAERLHRCVAGKVPVMALDHFGAGARDLRDGQQGQSGAHEIGDCAMAQRVGRSIARKPRSGDGSGNWLFPAILVPCIAVGAHEQRRARQLVFRLLGKQRRRVGWQLNAPGLPGLVLADGQFRGALVEIASG